MRRATPSLAVVAAAAIGSLVCLGAAAAPPQAARFVVATSLDYKTPEKHIKTGQAVQLEVGRQDWTLLAGPKDGLSLWGRISDAQADAVTLTMVLKDAARPAEPLARPTIAALLGQKAMLVMGQPQGGELAVSTVVERAQAPR